MYCHFNWEIIFTNKKTMRLSFSVVLRWVAGLSGERWDAKTLVPNPKFYALCHTDFFLIPRMHGIVCHSLTWKFCQFSWGNAGYMMLIIVSEILYLNLVSLNNNKKDWCRLINTWGGNNKKDFWCWKVNRCWIIKWITP